MPSLYPSDSKVCYTYQNEDQVDPIDDAQAQSPSLVVKRRKRVRFSDYSKLNLIPNLNYYTEQEKQAMYLTKEDKERIKEENSQTVEEIRNGKLPDTRLHYFRGLEWLGIDEIHNQRQFVTQITLSLILNEQERTGGICPDWIKNVYRRMTEDSRVNAFKMAHFDAQSTTKEIVLRYSAFKSEMIIEWVSL